MFFNRMNVQHKMYIHQLSNASKETIFLKVYERQCYVKIMSNGLMRSLFDMLWLYTNPLARSIVWKWLVWVVHRSLYPEAITWRKDEVYVRFREWIRKSYNELYQRMDPSSPSDPSQDSPLNLDVKWYNIEKEINRGLRTFLKRKNRDQVENHILSIHEDTRCLSATFLDQRKRRQIILDFRACFPRPFFRKQECDECGLKDALITYPCKHIICTSCFTEKTKRFSVVCTVCRDMERRDSSSYGTLRQKGWNHYVRKHCPHFEDYKKCVRCRYYRISKDIVQTNICENCYFFRKS